MGNPAFFHCNRRLAVVSAEGGTPRSLTEEFDEDTHLIDWKSDGIYFWGFQKTSSHLFRIQPDKPQITRLTSSDNLQAFGFSLTHDGRQMAFVTGSPSSLREVFISEVNGFSPRKLTDMTRQTRSLILGKSEVISWKSKDGTTIEGVLTKPADFDPAKKRPLLCIIHGGPTGFDQPTLLANRYDYPADIWAGGGALILRVNYRGSTGYGEKFRQLNVGNLGVGDAWDVLSGVDHLIKLGWVDLHGLEPGRLYLGLPDHFIGSLRGHFRGRRHLQLGDVLLQHRHNPVHDPVPRQGPDYRPSGLSKDFAHVLHQERENTDADPARRIRQARADRQRL